MTVVNEGERFGRLIVLKRVEAPSHVSDKHRVFVSCLCDCGEDTIIRYGRLKKGDIVSCGCYRKEYMSESKKKHGMRGTRFYKIWAGIKQRCKNENDSSYENYGGRGITFCDKWLEFEGFMEDMYESYIKHSQEYGEDNTSIDRIDVNGNYELTNCKWATNLEQLNNKRDNISIEVNGITYNSLSDLAREYNIEYYIVFRRYKEGLRDIDLIKEKQPMNIKTNGIRIEYKGKKYYSLNELHADYPVISLKGMQSRWRNGKRGDDLVAPSKR